MRSMHRRLVTGGTALAVTLATGALVVSPTAQAASRATVHPALASSLCSQDYLPLPDPSCTPGVLNPDVTQDTIYDTICVSGWTATIRPSTTYTNRLKAQGIIDYGYTDTYMGDYEEDHFIPLELGGAPSDPANLWPEPHYVTSGSGTSYTKDGVETKLKNAVCAGRVTLADAQNALVTDWTTALSSLGL
jgi:hypothetical protein